MLRVKPLPELKVLQYYYLRSIEHHPGLREDLAYYHRMDEGNPDKSLATLRGYVRKHNKKKRLKRNLNSHSGNHNNDQQPHGGKGHIAAAALLRFRFALPAPIFLGRGRRP